METNPTTETGVQPKGYSCKARQTGTMITVAPTAEFGIEPATKREWMARCDDHGESMTRPTRTETEKDACSPMDWCSACFGKSLPDRMPEMAPDLVEPQPFDPTDLQRIIIVLPRKFYENHLDRGHDNGVVVEWKKTKITAVLSETGWNELYKDAVVHAGLKGQAYKQNQGLVNSAKATVRAMDETTNEFMEATVALKSA